MTTTLLARDLAGDGAVDDVIAGLVDARMDFLAARAARDAKDTPHHQRRVAIIQERVDALLDLYLTLTLR